LSKNTTTRENNITFNKSTALIKISEQIAHQFQNKGSPIQSSVTVVGGDSIHQVANLLKHLHNSISYAEILDFNHYETAG